jgi:hypothetical protein
VHLSIPINTTDSREGYMGDIVTSVRLDEDKWKKAKIRAIEDGITLGEFLDEALDIRLSPQAAELLKKYGKKP